jgi:hypothetical protein
MVTRSGSSARWLCDPRLVTGRGATKISYSAVRDYVADRRSPLADLASYLSFDGNQRPRLRHSI